MFHEEKCDFCGECLERCYYLNFDRESGSKEFERLVRVKRWTGSGTVSPASPAMNTARKAPVLST